MKKKHILTILLFVLFASCKDKGPMLIPEENSFKVFPARMVQNVLLENIVSESVIESVENSFFVRELEKKYGSRFIVGNLHKQDWLETHYTNELTTMLGGLGTYPRAAVNRMPGTTLLPDAHITMLQPIHWEYTIEKALGQNAQISLAVETMVSKNSTGSIKLHIAHKNDLPADMRVGLYMVEDNIQSIFQQGSNNNFMHQHVMKNSLFEVEGDSVTLISEDPSGGIVTKEYNDIELKFYKPEHLYLIAYVFNYDKDYRNMKIYNAIRVKFGGVKFWNE